MSEFYENYPFQNMMPAYEMAPFFEKAYIADMSFERGGWGLNLAIADVHFREGVLKC